MAKTTTQHKNLCRKNSTNPLNKEFKPKQSTVDFLLNYSKSLETNLSNQNDFQISLN